MKKKALPEKQGTSEAANTWRAQSRKASLNKGDDPLHHDTAAGLNVMPGDPLALLADQKRDNVRNVVRLSQPTQSGHLCSHLSPLGILRQHLGLGEAGGHGVDCDAAPSQFLGERPGELLARCLAPHVHSEARKAHRRGARRDIDDPTSVPHTTCGFLKSKKGSLRVQSERRVELVLRDFGYGVRLKPTRVVHQNIEAAELV